MIIGICGLIGAGKDTIASHLIQQHGFVKESFATPVKDITAMLFNWPRHLLEGDTTESRDWRDLEDAWWSAKIGYTVTPRKMLQVIGTEVMRNNFYDNIWVAIAERKIQQSSDHIVISDCRFPNEIQTIKNLGGKVIRVKRGADPEWFKVAEIVNRGPDKNNSWNRYKTLLESYKVHASESAWAGTDFDAVIENNGTIEDLKNNVDCLMRSI